MGPILKQILSCYFYHGDISYISEREEKKPILRLGRETQDLDFLCPERPQVLGWSSQISPANGFFWQKTYNWAPNL